MQSSFDGKEYSCKTCEFKDKDGKLPCYAVVNNLQGWQMVKSETRRDAEIPVRNPSPRPFGENFRDSKK